MPEPTRAEDYERLTWIADQLDELGAQSVAGDEPVLRRATPDLESSRASWRFTG
jgi:hypothetical protein